MHKIRMGERREREGEGERQHYNQERRLAHPKAHALKLQVYGIGLVSPWGLAMAKRDSSGSQLTSKIGAMLIHKHTNLMNK